MESFLEVVAQVLRGMGVVLGDHVFGGAFVDDAATVVSGFIAVSSPIGGFNV